MTNIAPGHAYGLSFVHSNTKQGKNTPPELILTLSTDGWNRVKERISTDDVVVRVSARDYLRHLFPEPWEGFITSTYDIGFNKCGYIRETDGETQLSFPLVSQKCSSIALSIHALFWYLDVVLVAEEEKKASSNRLQFFTVSTRCQNVFPYGHATGGYVFPIFRRWLLQKGLGHGDIPMVTAAMMDTGYSIASFTSKKDERDYRRLMDVYFRARIYEDGRFILECPGNACDLSMYPDAMASSDPEFFCSFSCHNLDGAVQQLTLLSGLAALSDLARKELEQ